MKLATVVMLGLLLAACAPVTPAPPAGARVDAVTLAAERVGTDRFRLILQNGFDGSVGYNLCTSALQRRSGSTWEHVRTDDVCTMEMRSLPAGQDATFEKRLPAALAAGEYRYLTSVEIPIGTSQAEVATPPFRIP
jgi:hypothetical protein